MNSNPVLRILKANAFLLVVIAALALVISKSIVAGMAMHENFATKGNDDIMRLLTVRDWLAGQGWYDVRQYRLMPPEGVSLHWSRYIDAGISAIILPLTMFVPMDTAEQIAVTVWPTLVLVVSVLVVGFGSRRVFGTTAACFAVLCIVLWPLTADLHSRAGNLDHHNIQWLMMVIMSFAVIWPNHPRKAGFIGGIAAAFSLAVGLESLVFIVGVGIIVFVRAALSSTQESRKFLATFCTTLGLGCVGLWLGQTGPADRAVLMCDQLGPPTLLMVGIAMIASLFVVVLANRQTNPFLNLGLAAGVTIAGLLVAWPMLAHCLAGPYAQIPAELQELIATQVTEAKPGLVYARTRAAAALVFTIPIFVAVGFGLIKWFGERDGSVRGKHAHKALGLLLLMCMIGIPMMFLQMRTVIIAAAVAPMIGGVVMADRIGQYLGSRNLKDGLVALVIGLMLLSPKTIVRSVAPILPSSTGGGNSAQDDCRSYKSLIALNEVPSTVIFTHINFGPSLIWATHHSSLAAPYHRNADAFLNGIVPFQMEEADFVSYVRDTTATHLLLCRGFNYQSEYVRGLASGGSADWLRRVPVSSEDQLLFEILR